MGHVDDVIADRLKLLAEYVDELRSYQERAATFRVYLDDKMLRRAVERALQVAVEACLDIGRRLIALEGFRYPEDNKDMFQVNLTLRRRSQAFQYKEYYEKIYGSG